MEKKISSGARPEPDAYLLDLLDRPIAFHRIFARLLRGSVNAALMLSQAVYWSKRASRADGAFWKTAEEWTEETGLTVDQQKGARRLLRGKDFWKEDVRGVPATVHYLVDRRRLGIALRQFVENPQT